jgi:hypothetical protein
MTELTVRILAPCVPCKRCSYGSDIIEPRVVRLGWEPGKVMSEEHKEWFAAALEAEFTHGRHAIVPPVLHSPVYVPCPECKGEGVVELSPEEVREVLTENGFTVIADPV